MERNNGGLAAQMAFMYLAGTGLGIGIGGALLGKEGEADTRVKRVQQYNQQLGTQLEAGRMITRLVVKDQDGTFSFQTVNDGETQTCSGEFKVKNKAAVATGDLACTAIVAVKPDHVG